MVRIMARIKVRNMGRIGIHEGKRGSALCGSARGESRIHRFRFAMMTMPFLGLLLLGACQDDDCINCLELGPPVVPTGVHSISGDGEVIIQWYDISYSPYDGRYNENVVSYRIYSRFYTEGDEQDPDRDFYLIGEVAWDENFDPATGLHLFYDVDAVNESRYEYAVAAVNVAGLASALSYEFITDAPLPMSPYETDVELFDSLSAEFSHLGGFDFSRAGADVGDCTGSSGCRSPPSRAIRRPAGWN